MGISISARLLYGCYYAELPEEILDEVNEMLDNDEIDYASPYYDSPRDEWIVGVSIPCWDASPWDLKGAIEEAYGKLPSFFGSRDSVGLYVSPHAT